MNIKLTSSILQEENLVILLKEDTDITAFCASEKEIHFVNTKIEQKNTIIHLNQLTRSLFFIHKANQTENSSQLQEEFRVLGYELWQLVKKEKLTNLQVTSFQEKNLLLAFTEGLLLSSYQFLKYKSQGKENILPEIKIKADQLTEGELTELNHLIQANFIARNLVNEPVIYLTAEKLSEEIETISKDAGFDLEVYHRSKIEALNMIGLLTVNKGSVDPPTFNILEYKPLNAQNEKPYVLVGKGVVYDTGGLSLKPTSNSMDMMKCDMAGAATVAGTLYAVAKNKLPVHVVGLIPATDNRPGGNAITPGDVIKYVNNKTVEILNTDAEGRLILADALCHASHYDPELVIDFATLTGSAVRAIGKEASAMMGTASEEERKLLLKSGEDVFERLVEFPLWQEYGEQLKSDIADITNLGGASAGMITAGKFLEHFTNYPWIHLDIAGTAYLNATDKYRGKNATGTGVRLMYHFIKSKIK